MVWTVGALAKFSLQGQPGEPTSAAKSNLEAAPFSLGEVLKRTSVHLSSLGHMLPQPVPGHGERSWTYRDRGARDYHPQIMREALFPKSKSLYY